VEVGMARLEEVFSKAVHQKWASAYGHCPPGDQIELGEFGTVTNGRFFRVGRLSDIGIQFNKRANPTLDAYQAQSRGVKERKLSTRGRASSSLGQQSATSQFSVTFESQSEVYFLCMNNIWESIDSLAMVESQLEHLHANNSWSLEHVIVTSRLVSGSATVIISEANGASIVMEANASADSLLDVVKIKAALTIVRSEKVGIATLNSPGSTPMFGLHKLVKRYKVVGDLSLKPVLSDPANGLEPTHKPDTNSSDFRLMAFTDYSS
jgi:hypothetical protein